MIVVVASTYDVRAQRIVAHWGSHGATMLTAEDLCMPGWSLTVPKLIEPTAVIGGRTVPAAEIRGILTLRPCIFPEELQGFHSSDRKYVAAELNAFLLAWLSAQSCPVLNRPTACSLAGPNWRAEQWAHAAAGLGIPARSRRSLPNRDGAIVECDCGWRTLLRLRRFGPERLDAAVGTSGRRRSFVSLLFDRSQPLSRSEHLAVAQ